MNPTRCRKSFSFRGMAVATALAASLAMGTASAKTPDLDGDGIANLVDPDVDGDGIPNARDLNVDGGICRRGPFKGKYVGDHLLNGDPRENDIDADGLKDDSDAELDIDGDGRKDDAIAELDIDGDGKKDDSVSETDVDGDGLLNYNLREADMDGDGRQNLVDVDFDGDGIEDDGGLGLGTTVEGSGLTPVNPDPIASVRILSDSAVSESWIAASSFCGVAPEMDPQKLAALVQALGTAFESSDRGFTDRFTEVVVDPVEDRRRSWDDRAARPIVVEPVSTGEETIPAP